MNNSVLVALAQSSFSGTRENNVARAVELVERGAAAGVNILLLPELFERPYFCKTQLSQDLTFAETVGENATLIQLQSLAKKHQMVLPFSFYERVGQVRFNSVAVIDADGEMLGVYRKSHLPDGPGYQEKFYFSPGDTGFRVWQTKYGRIGIGICWDQWFPEAARIMVLMGAELLFYPTAIGTEPHLPDYDSSFHWTTVMQGHAAANLVPVIASNRVGREQQKDAYGNNVSVSFYGHSFITNEFGQVIADAGENDNIVVSASFDLLDIDKRRREWGFFRDRRPELYNRILSY